MNTKVKATTAITPAVQTEPTYAQLVDQYKKYGKEAAEKIVKMAETLVKAEQYLPPFQFDQFCDEVRLIQDGPTHKKLRKIGNKYARFEPFLDKLPNAWTTLYKLASIEEGEFDKVTKDDLFGPLMTAAEIDRIVRPSKKKPQKEGLVIRFSGVDASKQLEVYLELKTLANKFAIDLIASQDLVTSANNAVTSQSMSNFFASTVPNGTEPELRA